MLEPVQRARQERLKELPLLRPDVSQVAVFLNNNARRVTSGVTRRLEKIAGSDHVFRSHSLEEAEALAREIVKRGYGTVVCGGGDGTLVTAINLIQHHVEETNAWRIERYRRNDEVQGLLACPRFAFLKLGTGNGMSRVVGSNKPERDLQRIVELVPGRTQHLPLIEQEGERFFFAGMGYDSQILEDYNRLKARAKNWLFKTLMQNFTGYLMATLGATLPRVMTGRAEKMEARIINRGRAYYVDPRRGDFVEEVEPGATIYEGRIRLICAGTTPFYGFGLKAFPFARMMPRMMNLRVASLGPLQLLPFGLPALWRGSFRRPSGLHDFLVERFSVELAKPYPFQHSGDVQRPRDRLDFRIADDDLEIVDLYRPRRFS